MPIVCVRIVVSTPKYSRLEPAIIQSLMHDAGIGHLNEMQTLGIPRIRSGSNLLIVAPTGSGKTEAALLPVLESLSSGQEAGIRALYITPLRALNRDMIDRVQHLVSRTGLSAAVRHGDTPPSERRKQAAAPPDILITTPETLQAILPGKIMQRHLKNVKYVIIDEVHQLAADRRGIQLAVALERLRSVAGGFQRIGLSATVGHPVSIAALFGGENPLEILAAPLEKQYEYRVERPPPHDQVVQDNSRGKVTSLSQRVGRSGHKLDRTSRGLVLAVSSDDAIESLAAVQAARDQDLEPLHVHRLALDVLAHQIVGAALDQGGTAPWSEVLSTIRSSEPFRELEDVQADRVAEFMAHLGNIRQEGDKIRVTPKGRRYYFENLSTIRDERRYPVMDLTTQRQVGILGEEFMMIQAREGLHFIVRGRPWKMEKIGKDGMAYLTPVSDPNAMIPGWDGEMLPVPFGLAQRVGRIRKEIDARLDRESVPKTVEHFEKAWPINKTGAKRLAEKAANHCKSAAPVPTGNRIS